MGLLSDPALSAAWARIHAGDDPCNYVLFGYTSRTELGVAAAGDGGYGALAEQLQDDQIMFGAFMFRRDGHKAYCFISWIGPAISTVRRGRAASATLEVAHFLEQLEGGFQAQLHAMEAADLQLDSVVEHLKDSTKGDVIEVPSTKGSDSYQLRLAGSAAEGGARVSSTSELKIHDLETLFASLDTYGTGVINFRQFSTWWKNEHADESPGKLITDDELNEIRRLWMGCEIEGSGVDIEAFHTLAAQLKEEGLLRAAVARDKAEAEAMQRAHGE
jgi:hypothetical protein